MDKDESLVYSQSVFAQLSRLDLYFVSVDDGVSQEIELRVVVSLFCATLQVDVPITSELFRLLF